MPDRTRFLERAYRGLRPLLFTLEAERAHELSLDLASAMLRIPMFRAWLRRACLAPPRPVSLMGLALPNPVGLAAGLDKDGRYIPLLSALGFGWLELGTVTCQPQPGNARPRLFRFPAERALINRMGFNNEGAAALAARVRRLGEQRPVLGINIGKNRDTPLDSAPAEYTRAFFLVADVADYVTINVSSPNTAGLRSLQLTHALAPLLGAVKRAQLERIDRGERKVPIAVKVSPDLSPGDLDSIADLCVELGMEGLIATNTTLARPGGVGTACEGGLSGAPLAALARTSIRRLCDRLQGRIPVIGVGGINSPAAARAHLEAGASAVQLYTGLVYEGPGLVSRIVRELAG